MYNIYNDQYRFFANQQMIQGQPMQQPKKQGFLARHKKAIAGLALGAAAIGGGAAFGAAKLGGVKALKTTSKAAFNNARNSFKQGKGVMAGMKSAGKSASSTFKTAAKNAPPVKQTMANAGASAGKAVKNAAGVVSGAVGSAFNAAKGVISPQTAVQTAVQGVQQGVQQAKQDQAAAGAPTKTMSMTGDYELDTILSRLYSRKGAAAAARVNRNRNVSNKSNKTFKQVKQNKPAVNNVQKPKVVTAPVTKTVAPATAPVAKPTTNVTPIALPQQGQPVQQPKPQVQGQAKPNVKGGKKQNQQQGQGQQVQGGKMTKKQLQTQADMNAQALLKAQDNRAAAESAAAAAEEHKNGVWGQAKEGNIGAAAKNAGKKVLGAAGDMVSDLPSQLYQVAMPMALTAGITGLMNKGGSKDDDSQDQQGQGQQQMQPQQGQPMQQPQYVQQQVQRSDINYVLNNIRMFCDTRESMFAFNEMLESFM